jgi:peptidoglycan hydrolase CwlO-like protein
MKKFVVILLLLTMVVFAPIIKGDEIDDIKHQLDNLSRDLTASLNATKPLESELIKLQKRLEEIKFRVTYLESEILRKELEVRKGEEALTYQKTVLDQRIFTYYKNAKKAEISFITLVAADNLSTSLQNFFYQRTLADQDKQTILKVIVYIKNLEEKKKSLESENTRLASIKTEVDKNYIYLNGEVSKAKTYQAELSNKIAQLSARQQQLVSQRQASLNVPRSAGTSARGCSDDRGVDPGFSNRFAFFTYGAPHRNGLNQYGAWGRAKAGQNEETILKEYYPNFSLKKDYDQNVNIKTTTGWSGSIEDYVKRIYEVPDSWTDNNLAALKAQVVAARSYALNSMQRNGSICTSEQCQVFKDSEKGGNWAQAVEATKGWVLMDGDKPAFSEYASTHGGYILNISKFDGKDGNPNSFSELNDRAYDRESPWFYCDWGARSEYNKTAWMKSEEVADIVNIILLAKKDGSVGEHLYQVDKSNPGGTDTWGHDKVKQELKNRGGNPFNSISDVGIDWDKGAGKTTQIRFTGDAGTQSFDAVEFKNWFNVRAPANIQIIGPLFNVEHK